MGGLLPINDARRLVLASIMPGGSESTPLAGADGRILAGDAVSPVDVPPFDPSAMDGYAVPPPGAAGELTVVGESRAGAPFGAPLGAGMAVEISTGARVPDGTWAVAPMERCEIDGERVRVPDLAQGRNVRCAGEDVRAGDTVVVAGTELGPAELGVLAGTGHVEVECRVRPRVAIVATGDELVDPPAALAPGEIWSSNGLALAAAAERAGAVVVSRTHARDERSDVREALAGAIAAADAVCISGGVSVGPHDHVKAALADLGAEEVFWGVALRPGKPTWFGLAPAEDRRVATFGLPGNPVSALVTFALFARPALRAFQGADPLPRRVSARLEGTIARHPGREQAVRVALAGEDDGLTARPTGPQGSHQLTSMIGADGLAIVPMGEGEVGNGERLDVELLR